MKRYAAKKVRRRGRGRLKQLVNSKTDRYRITKTKKKKTEKKKIRSQQNCGCGKSK